MIEKNEKQKIEKNEKQKNVMLKEFNKKQAKSKKAAMVNPQQEEILKGLYAAKGEAITKIEIYSDKLKKINEQIARFIQLGGDR